MRGLCPRARRFSSFAMPARAAMSKVGVGVRAVLAVPTGAPAPPRLATRSPLAFTPLPASAIAP